MVEFKSVQTVKGLVITTKDTEEPWDEPEVYIA